MEKYIYIYFFCSAAETDLSLGRRWCVSLGRGVYPLERHRHGLVLEIVKALRQLIADTSLIPSRRAHRARRLPIFFRFFLPIALEISHCRHRLIQRIGPGDISGVVIRPYRVGPASHYVAEIRTGDSPIRTRACAPTCLNNFHRLFHSSAPLRKPPPASNPSRPGRYSGKLVISHDEKAESELALAAEPVSCSRAESYRVDDPDSTPTGHRVLIALYLRTFIFIFFFCSLVGYSIFDLQSQSLT